jgi:hypothetical protein
MPNATGTVALTSDLPVVTNLLPLNNTWTGTNTFNNTIVGSITGNAATATTANSATTAATATNALKLNNTTATNSNSGGKIVQRDGNGSFSAGTISAALNGNATTCTLASNSYKLEGLVSTNANQGNTIVRRASNGSFSAGTITATLSGSSTSCTGNSATVTNGVYKTGTQTIGGNKTFNSNTTFSSANAIYLTSSGTKNIHFNNAVTNGTARIQHDGTGTGRFVFYPAYQTSTSKYCYISADGSFVSTGNVTAYSDLRLKKDIEVIPNALDKVSAIKGVTYTNIDGEERRTGVIAQDIIEVLPEAVQEDENGMLSVAYGNIVGLLIEAIKELKEEVEELKR